MADDGNDDDDAKENEFNEMVNACEIIDSAVQRIRHAILLNRNAEDVDSDNEYEEETATMVADQRSQVSDSNEENQQRVMRHLPEEHKREIQMKVEGFMVSTIFTVHVICSEHSSQPFRSSSANSSMKLADGMRTVSNAY